MDEAVGQRSYLRHRRGCETVGRGRRCGGGHGDGRGVTTVDQATGQEGGAAAVDKAAGVVDLSSPWAWSTGTGRGNVGVVSAVDVVVAWRGGVIAVELASTASLRNTLRSRTPPATRLRLLR